MQGEGLVPQGLVQGTEDIGHEELQTLKLKQMCVTCRREKEEQNQEVSIPVKAAMSVEHRKQKTHE